LLASPPVAQGDRNRAFGIPLADDKTVKFGYDFTGGKGGGGKLAKNLKEVEELAGSIIGMNLVTPQTTKEGKKVHQVLIAEDVYYPGDSETSEFYMSVLLNRARGRNMIMYSTEGGMDIEEVADKTPHLIFTE